MLIIDEAEGKVKRPFSDFIIRYMDEVTPKKRRQAWEWSLLNRLLKNSIADVVEPTESDFAKYRDSRLSEVQGVTVAKELLLISNIFTIATKEWKWWNRDNPISNIRKPKPNPPRDRRVSEQEIEKLKAASKYALPLDSNMKRIMHAFLFAIETAMRAGEISSLTWENINFEKRTAFIPMTKNGEPRTVPLSVRAIELLEQLPDDNEYCFNIWNIAENFYKLRNKTDIKNLHFHDSRHEAITRLAKKVDALALARIVGHKRVNQLMTYYNESPEDIALKL